MMNIEPIKTLSDAISAKLAEVEQTKADAGQYRDAIANGIAAAATIASLCQQRAQLVALAGMDEVQANTANIDQQISDAEIANAGTLNAAKDAEAALANTQQQLASLNADIAGLTAQRTQAVMDLCEVELLSAAESDYGAALALMKSAIARIIACTEVFDCVAPDRNIRSIADDYVSVNQAKCLAGLRSDGYAPPIWLSDSLLGKQERQEIVQALTTAGFDSESLRPALKTAQSA